MLVGNYSKALITTPDIPAGTNVMDVIDAVLQNIQITINTNTPTQTILQVWRGFKVLLVSLAYQY